MGGFGGAEPGGGADHFGEGVGGAGGGGEAEGGEEGGEGAEHGRGGKGGRMLACRGAWMGEG